MLPAAPAVACVAGGRTGSALCARTTLAAFSHGCNRFVGAFSLLRSAFARRSLGVREHRERMRRKFVSLACGVFFSFCGLGTKRTEGPRPGSAILGRVSHQSSSLSSRRRRRAARLAGTWRRPGTCSSLQNGQTGARVIQRYTHDSALAGPSIVAPASRQPKQ